MDVVAVGGDRHDLRCHDAQGRRVERDDPLRRRRRSAHPVDVGERVDVAERSLPAVERVILDPAHREQETVGHLHRVDRPEGAVLGDAHGRLAPRHAAGIHGEHDDLVREDAVHHNVPGRPHDDPRPEPDGTVGAVENLARQGDGEEPMVVVLDEVEDSFRSVRHRPDRVHAVDWNRPHRQEPATAGGIACDGSLELPAHEHLSGGTHREARGGGGRSGPVELLQLRVEQHDG